MNTQSRPQDEAPVTDEGAVEDYLRDHPDFFSGRDELLLKLRVPHSCGPAVSLIERQVRLLRGQNRKYKRKLMELVQTGRDNDRLNHHLHRLALALLETTSPEAAIDVLHKRLRGEFRADGIALRLPALPPGTPAAKARPMNRDEPAPAAFGGFLTAGRPQCGRLKPEQMEWLFGVQGEAIGSAALVPLGGRPVKGLLAIGSHDENHFHPAMDTLFLEHLGELAERALRPFLTGDGA